MGIYSLVYGIIYNKIYRSTTLHQMVLDGPVVKIPACHAISAGDRGSIPRREVFFALFFFFLPLANELTKIFPELYTILFLTIK
jgi:hypothetical protein